jgi:hypothetical protein
MNQLLVLHAAHFLSHYRMPLLFPLIPAVVSRFRPLLGRIELLSNILGCAFRGRAQPWKQAYLRKAGTATYSRQACT